MDSRGVIINVFVTAMKGLLLLSTHTDLLPTETFQQQRASRTTNYEVVL